MAVNIEQSLFAELAEFLVSQPSLEEIASYKVFCGISGISGIATFTGRNCKL
jgi:hypothetical protein